MEVERHFFLGEVLYLWANYEKGRCNPRKLWMRSYIVSLQESINGMRKIIEQLSDATGNPHEMETVTLIISRPEIFRMDKSLLNQWKMEGIKLLTLRQFSTEFDHVNKVMLDINSQLLSATNQSGKEKKTKIHSLLCAFHNLPKIYLNSQSISFLGNKYKAISCSEALDYAKQWLEI